MALNQMELGLMAMAVGMAMALAMAMNHLHLRIFDLHFCNLRCCDVTDDCKSFVTHKVPCPCNLHLDDYWEPCSKSSHCSRLHHGHSIAWPVRREAMKEEEEEEAEDEELVLA